LIDPAKNTWKASLATNNERWRRAVGAAQSTFVMNSRRRRYAAELGAHVTGNGADRRKPPTLRRYNGLPIEANPRMRAEKSMFTPFDELAGINTGRASRDKDLHKRRRVL